MPRTLALPLLLLLAACETGKIAVDDDTAAGSDDTGAPDDTDPAADTADTAADTDTGGGDTDATTPAPSAWAGDWDGRVALLVDDPRGGTFPLCEGDATVVVDDDGAFAGDGLCETDVGPADIAMTFVGAVDADGGITGTATLDLMGGPVDYELSGTTDRRSLTVGWTGSLESPEGEIPMEGSFSG